MIELSVVLPCLNEAETLATCIKKARASMEALGVDGEIVVADNGSTDGSQAIADSLGARVVPVPERGYGAALRTGIAAAEGRFVIMADADDSYALDDLGPFVDALRGGADLVMGNRFAGGIEPGAMPALHRYLGNPVLSWVGRLFFRVPINDFHCGMRGFRRDRIMELGLTTVGMEFASEMVVRSAINGLHITEVPTTLKPDGRSRAPAPAYVAGRLAAPALPPGVQPALAVPVPGRVPGGRRRGGLHAAGRRAGHHRLGDVRHPDDDRGGERDHRGPPGGRARHGVACLRRPHSACCRAATGSNGSSTGSRSSGA